MVYQHRSTCVLVTYRWPVPGQFLSQQRVSWRAGWRTHDPSWVLPVQRLREQDWALQQQQELQPGNTNHVIILRADLKLNRGQNQYVFASIWQQCSLIFESKSFMRFSPVLVLEVVWKPLPLQSLHNPWRQQCHFLSPQWCRVACPVEHPEFPLPPWFWPNIPPPAPQSLQTNKKGHVELLLSCCNSGYKTVVTVFRHKGRIKVHQIWCFWCWTTTSHTEW